MTARVPGPEIHTSYKDQKIVPRLSLGDLPSAPDGRSGWPWTEESPRLEGTLSRGKAWPRISIVTPSYNQVLYVEETIRSVLLQGYPNLEYIVIDGGSTDGTIEILRKYEPFFSFLHIGPDGGQSAALAAGFRRATGEILAWINSDDRYQPGALARVGRYFDRHPRVVFVNSDVNHIDSESRIFERSYLAVPCRQVTANLGWHNWLQQGCFWQRSAYEKCGGMDESLHFCMDRDLFLRLTATGPSRKLSGPPTSDFRHQPEAKSYTLHGIAEQEGRLLISRYSSPIFRRFPQVLYLRWKYAMYTAMTREWVQKKWGIEL